MGVGGCHAIRQTFCFETLVLRESLARILFVEQGMQAAVESFGQGQTREIVRHLHIQMNRRGACHFASQSNMARCAR